MWRNLAAGAVLACALAACSGPAPTRVLGEKVVRSPAVTASPSPAAAAPAAPAAPRSAAPAAITPPAAPPPAQPATQAAVPPASTAPAPARTTQAPAPASRTTPAPTSTTPSPQWSGQSTSCAAVPPPSGASTLPANVSATVSYDSTSAPAGQPIPGHITVSNAGPAPVTLHENTNGGDGVAVYDSWGTELRTSHIRQPVTATVYQIPAGGSVSIPFRVPTTQCGKTAQDPDTPLAPGGYSAQPWFLWSTPAGQSGHFDGPLQNITVTS